MLQRYVFKELIVTFFLTLLAFTFIVFIGSVLKSLNKYQQIGVGYIVVVIPYLVPYTLAYTIPFASLAGCSLVYGRLSQENELTAVRASGISLRKVVCPAILLGLVLSLFCLKLNDTIIPECHHKVRQITRTFLGKLLTGPIASIVPTRGPEIDTGDWKIDFLKFENGIAYGVAAIRLKDNKKIEEYYSEEAIFDMDAENNKLILTLKRGNVTHHVIHEGRPVWQRAPFREATVSVMLPMDITHSPRRLADYTLAGLRNLAKVSSNTRWSRAEILTELNSKLALSVSPIVFALLGSSLGMRLKHRSRLLCLSISVFILAVVYYPATLLGQMISINQVVPPEIGCWAANALLLLAGLFLIRKV